MRYTDNYELNLVEGSDIVNPLVQDVPNYEAIDAAMFDNKEHSVGVATELKTGTVHSLTRQNADAAVFRFTATSDYTVGDTFEVDGVQVSALLVDGTTLPNRCYIIGSEVLASLKGTLLTVYANRTTASDSDRLGGQLPAYYATDADLDNLEGVVDAHTNQIRQISDKITWSSVGSALGTNYISLPANFSEVHIVVLLGGGDRIALNILKDDLIPDQSTYFNDGYYMDNSHYCRVALQFTSDNKVTLASCFYNSSTNSASNTYFGVKIR